MKFEILHIVKLLYSLCPALLKFSSTIDLSSIPMHRNKHFSSPIVPDNPQWYLVNPEVKPFCNVNMLPGLDTECSPAIVTLFLRKNWKLLLVTKLLIQLCGIKIVNRTKASGHLAVSTGLLALKLNVRLMDQGQKGPEEKDGCYVSEKESYFCKKIL